MTRQPHRRHADATGTGMHQHRLTLTQTRQITERVQSRQEHQRHRRRLHVRPPLRHPDEVALVDEGGVGESAGDHAHDAVAGPQAGDAGPGRGDHTGGLGAEEPGLAGIHVQCVEHVAEVQARGPHLHPHLTPLRALQQVRGRYEGEAVEVAPVLAVEAPGQAGDGEETRSAGQTGEPGDADGVVADDELGVPAGQQAGQLRGRRREVRVLIEVEQGEAAGVLGVRAAHQAPDGGGGEVAHRLPEVGGDGSAGDEHQAGRGGGVQLQPLLHEVQGACGERVDGGRRAGLRAVAARRAVQRYEDQFGRR